MAERRTLVEGFRTAGGADAGLEKEFVFGNQAKATPPPRPHARAPDSEGPEGKGKAGKAVARVPLTTRVRGDYAAALKRASLERQLGGVFPNTLQDILEEALQPWLRANGYLN